MKSFNELTHTIMEFASWERDMMEYTMNQNAIMEAEDTPAGGYSRSAHSHHGTHRVEDQEMLGRVNSFIHNYLQTEVQDKKAALVGLRQKLNQVGLDFQFTGKETLPVGEDFRIPVTRYGGTFGTSPTHDLKNGFEVTDGLESPLTLNVNCEYLENGLYNINAKVAPLAEGVEDPEHEYDEELNGTNIGEQKKEDKKKEVPLVKTGQGSYSKEYYGDKAGKIRLRGKK